MSSRKHKQILEAIERYDFSTALSLLESSRVTKTWAKKNLSLHRIISVCFEESEDFCVNQVLQLMNKILELNPEAIEEQKHNSSLILTTLIHCRHISSWKIVDYLITKSPDPQLTDDIFYIVGRDLKTKGNENIKEIILKLAAEYPESFKGKGECGNLPIHNYVAYGTYSRDILEKIINAHPKGLEHPNYFGGIPLHYAKSMDAFLQIATADPEGIFEENEDGHTPLDTFIDSNEERSNGNKALDLSTILSFIEKQSTALEIKKDQLQYLLQTIAENLKDIEEDRKKEESIPESKFNEQERALDNLKRKNQDLSDKVDQQQADHKKETSIQQSKFNVQKRGFDDLRRKNKDLKHELDQQQAYRSDQLDQLSSLEKALDEFRKENKDLKDEKQKLKHSLNVYKAIEVETTKTEKCFLEILEENEAMDLLSIEQLKIIAASVKERLDIVKKEVDGPPTKPSLAELGFHHFVNSADVSKECAVRLIHDLHEELSKTQKKSFEESGSGRGTGEAKTTSAISNTTEQSEGSVMSEETEARTTMTASCADNCDPKESPDPSAKRQRVSVSPKQLQMNSRIDL